MFLGDPFLWFCIKSNRHKSVDTKLKSPFISYKFGCTYESQDYSKKWMRTNDKKPGYKSDKLHHPLVGYNEDDENLQPPTALP